MMTMMKGIALTALLLALDAVSAADKIVYSTTRDLPYDENNKLTSHVLVYPTGNPSCGAAQLPETYMFESYALGGEALQAVFPGASQGDCLAACMEAGTDRSVAHAVMPHRHWDGNGAFGVWFETTCKRVEVCLMNYHSRQTPIKVYWISPEGKRKFHIDIAWAERGTRCFSSFIGHEFEAEDGETGEVLERITIDHITTKAFGISPPSGRAEGHNFEAEIKRTLFQEWRRHNRVTRTFSELGFKKGRLPEDVFASMGAFYYNNRHNRVNEEWDGKGVFVNWWEIDCSFIQIPWDLKAKWQVRLLELVEAWAGVPIEQTDMYGLRRYEHGARLLTHVDREATHAVSLIVNIAQGNLTEPWPVEVFDHGNRLHEVIMEPGDIVYYESAKCLHSRNRPLMGPNAHYVNLFTHYRPTGDPKWYEKPNHEGVPDPVVEVEGECKLEKVATAETYNKQLGVVESVTCSDPRLGHYISPTLFKAESGGDLVKWWEMTSPSKPSEAESSTSSRGRDEL